MQQFANSICGSRVCGLLLGLVFSVGLSPSVLAQTTLAVTTTADELNDDGDCSLREAIQAANTDAPVDACPAGNGHDTIELGEGTYAITIDADGEDENQTGDFDLLSDITFTGRGVDKTTIEGPELDRILHVHGTTVMVSGITFLRGLASLPAGGAILNDGGILDVRNSSFVENKSGIYNTGKLTITNSLFYKISQGVAVGNVNDLLVINSVFDNNRTAIGTFGKAEIVNTKIINNVAAKSGGGIIGGGNSSITIIDSEISNNKATGSGGGILLESECPGLSDCTSVTLEIMGSTIANNFARNHGGAIFSQSGNITLINSTVSNNVAANGSGGAFLDFRGGVLRLINSTVTGNEAAEVGGISLNDLTYRGSIIAGNTAADGGADCRINFLNSHGHNLTGPSCDGGGTGDIVVDSGSVFTDVLGPLQDNGGPTPTHALLEGSPAIDAGTCTDLEGDPIRTDQRGFLRPAGATCDIGAFEFGASAPLVSELILLTPPDDTNPVNTNHAVTASLQNNDGDPIPDRAVDFEITDGPNAGLTSTATTDAGGEATFAWTSTVAGTDVVEASFRSSSGETLSATASKSWVAPGDCDIPRIVSEEVDRTSRTITLAFEDADGLSEISYRYPSDFPDPAKAGQPALENLEVIEDGGLASTNGIDFTASPPHPTAVTQVLRALGPGRVLYFPLITDACADPGPQVYDADPVRVFAGDSDELPSELTLTGAFPNPFNPSTTVRFALPEVSDVTLQVYDVLGRLVATLLDNSSLPAGFHELSFDASGLPSGAYLVRVEAGGAVETGRIILSK